MQDLFQKFSSQLYATFEYPKVMTWGGEDKKHREYIRSKALSYFPQTEPNRLARWAFNIYVWKSGKDCDIDNIPKLIIDAFANKQMRLDGSVFANGPLALYEDDGLSSISWVQVAGEKAIFDRTLVQIYTLALKVTGSTIASFIDRDLPTTTR